MEVLQPEEMVDLQRRKDEEEVASEENLKEVKAEETETRNVKKSKDEKGKKKDERCLEQVLKSLYNIGTSEGKLAAMCKKYTEILEENRKLQMQLKQSEKKNLGLQREKDQLQSEQSKALLTRSRLENLCRELQRQNKAIKEESLLKIREEEEKRKVVSAKFQTALGEVTTLMQQNNENNSKLRDENLEMQNKFKSLFEQYELREQQVEKMSKQMQLESELADMRVGKVIIEMFAEKQMFDNEKEQLLVELKAYQNKCQEMQKTEAALRNQITMYTEKYDEFQSALAKSNQIYSGFKSEMEKMSKKITKLEKETSVWKMKWEGSHKALLQMAAEKQQRDAELALTTRQLNQLQKLCRTLQSERTSLLSQLKTEGTSPKIEGASDESASVDDLIPFDSNVECSSEVKENLDSIISESLEKKDVDSEASLCGDSIEEIVHKTEAPQKETEGSETRAADGELVKEVSPVGDGSVASAQADSERVSTTASEPMKCEASREKEEDAKKAISVDDDGGQLSNCGAEESATNENSAKKDENSDKSNGETKKGKKGTKKRKK